MQRNSVAAALNRSTRTACRYISRGISGSRVRPNTRRRISFRCFVLPFAGLSLFHRPTIRCRDSKVCAAECIQIGEIAADFAQMVQTAGQFNRSAAGNSYWNFPVKQGTSTLEPLSCRIDTFRFFCRNSENAAVEVLTGELRSTNVRFILKREVVEILATILFSFSGKCVILLRSALVFRWDML